MQNLRKVLSYVPSIWRWVGVITLLNLLSASFTAIQPFLFKNIIDTVIRAAEHQIADGPRVILYTLGGLLALRVINSILNYAVNLTAEKTLYRIIVALRQAVFERTSRLSIDYFEQERAGAIIQRYGSNTTEVANWTNNSLSGLLPQILTMVISLSILTFTEPIIGLVTTIAIAVFFALQIPTLNRLRPLLKQSQVHIERASAYFTETITHMTTVRSLGGERAALNRQREELDSFADIRISRQKVLQRSIALRQSSYTLAIVISLGIVANGVLHGAHSPGDILLVSLYLQQIQGSLWPIGRMLIDTNEIDASAERIVTMLETKPTVVDAPDASKLDQLYSIEFRNVSFSYPGKRRKVLTGVSFRIEPGKVVALVGPSGTGKTTITKLLLRFYEPTSGQILINDAPIESFEQDSLRERIGVVMQDVALFNDSVEANLQLANPSASGIRLRQAAEQAHADVFINGLSDKYQTLVGERGVKLSGGEKQRIAIARAILKDPDLIILDEATSALDSQSEQHVQAGLHQLMSGRASLVIAHRLSTVMRADQILVLQNGKVVEQGSHDELAKKKDGLYARLFKLQTEGFLKS